MRAINRALDAVAKHLLTSLKRTFESWTLEDVAAVIKENTGEKWIDEVIGR